MAGQVRWRTPQIDRRYCHSILHRAEQLDALDAILPFDRRDQLAALLTDDDVATGSPLPWSAPESLLLKFVAHHLRDPDKCAEDQAMACRRRWKLACVLNLC